MTLGDRLRQNKQCFERIRELMDEIHELESLVAENLIKMHEEMQPADSQSEGCTQVVAYNSYS